MRSALIKAGIEPQAVPLADLAPIVVVAPHPDDEVVGCGGLIAACSRIGLVIDVVNVTAGEASLPSQGWSPPRLAAMRLAEQTSAFSILGASHVPRLCLHFPDGQVSGAIGHLAEALFGPLLTARTVFVCNPNDGDPDHRATAAAVALWWRRRKAARVFTYRVATTESTRVPGWYFELGHLEQLKRDAIRSFRDADGRRAQHPDEAMRRLVGREEVFTERFADQRRARQPWVGL